MPASTGLPFAGRGASLAEGGDGRTVPINVADTQISDYETVAASQTGQVLGQNGAIGDYLESITIVPETTGAGTIALLDGTVSTNIFVAGTLADLKPIIVPIRAKSTLGAWSVTTGGNVHCIAAGKFS